MGTEVSVILWHEDAQLARRATAAVMLHMQDIDARWNPEAADSELFRVNRQAGLGAVVISAELTRVIDKAIYYSGLTDGAFDISFASVGQFYDYRSGVAPNEAQRQGALEAIDYRALELDPETSQLRFLHPGMKIDLGGIAKGYAVDTAIELLQQYGIRHASVSAGGDTRLLGDRRGRPWMVGIRNPRKAGAVALLLPLEDVALSTSGDYERFFIDPVSGERIHHILNPRTGQSASGVVSASVVGPRGFDTDPLSTTVFVMGVERGMELIETLPEFDAVIIDTAGMVHYTSGLAE
jgi:thiamine biosynthesis lipoprotein